MAADRVNLECLQCHTWFSLYVCQTRGGRGKFCSRLCHEQWRRENPKGPPIIDRLMSRITKDECDCWLWTGPKNPGGYAAFTCTTREGPKTRSVHRLMYQMLVGTIPERMDLDHLCRVRHCVNPAHLEPVTRSENLRRGMTGNHPHTRKEHCPQGHPYSGENLKVSRSRRYCRECNRVRASENYHKRKQAAAP